MYIPAAPAIAQARQILYNRKGDTLDVLGSHSWSSQGRVQRTVGSVQRRLTLQVSATSNSCWLPSAAGGHAPAVVQTVGSSKPAVISGGIGPTAEAVAAHAALAVACRGSSDARILVALFGRGSRIVELGIARVAGLGRTRSAVFTRANRMAGNVTRDVHRVGKRRGVSLEIPLPPPRRVVPTYLRPLPLRMFGKSTLRRQLSAEPVRSRLRGSAGGALLVKTVAWARFCPAGHRKLLQGAVLIPRWHPAARGTDIPNLSLRGPYTGRMWNPFRARTPTVDLDFGAVRSIQLILITGP